MPGGGNITNTVHIPPKAGLGYITPVEFSRLSLAPVAPLPPAERVDMAGALT